MKQWRQLPRMPHVLTCFTLCVVSLLGCHAPVVSPSPVQETPSVQASVPLPSPQQPSPTAMSTTVPEAQGMASTKRSSASPSPAAPTIAPAMRPQVAQQALDDGEHTRAIALWSATIEEASPSQRPVLQISLARAHVRAGQPHEAIELLALVIGESDSPEEQAEALGLLAGAYETLGEWPAAINAFERYLELDAGAESYVRWHMAKAYLIQQEHEKSSQQLEKIALSIFPTAMRAEVLEELASAYRQLEDYDRALEVYEQILGFSRFASYRALIIEKQAKTLREAERDDEAVELFQRVIDEQPSTHASYLALLALDETEAAKITDLKRGEILYDARQYTGALEVLERHASVCPPDEVAETHYYMGLAYKKLERYSEAFEAYNVLIKEHPQDPLTPNAWLAKARAAAAYGGDPVGLYHEFRIRYPDHARAPEALWLAAKSLERREDWKRAASYYQQLHTDYPENEYAAEARFREGLAAYALGDMSGAQQTWASALQGDPENEEETRTLTWLGLAARATGDEQAGHDYWEQAIEASPWSYYGLRARDLKADVSLRLPIEETAMPPGQNVTEQDWQGIADWIDSWHTITETATVDLAADPLAIAGATLWRLDWHEESLTTYRLLRDQVKEAPSALLSLTRLSDDLKLYPISISCATRIIALGLKAGADEPPAKLLTLAYPTVYGHLVEAEAAPYALDPLLFLALIRQESRFDRWATSYAGAMGLTQVMPDTGDWIASHLDRASHRDEDLTRPDVSVRFGVWYLSWLLDRYDRDWIAALGAYNAGRARWTTGRRARRSWTTISFSRRRSWDRPRITWSRSIASIASMRGSIGSNDRRSR